MRTVGVVALAVAIVVIANSSAGAATQVAPTAITGSVASIGGTTATLSGTVNPNGLATTWQFDLGATTSYGTKAPTAAQSAGTGTANLPVSTSLTGLTPGTTYHYRLTANSSDGTTVGTDGIFTTLPAPTVTTGSASAIGPSQATVACSIDPNGIATTWFVEYGKTTGYGTQTSAQNAGSGAAAVNVTATLTGLETAVTYHFRCVGSSSIGTTRGADASFVTAEAPKVSTSAATSIGATSIRVNGTVNPSGRATTYYFEYGTSPSYGSKTSNASAGNGTSTISVSRSISGLKAGTVYHFRVVATSDAGTSRGSDLTVTTQSAPAVVTAGPSNVTSSSATVGGTVNPNGRSTSWFVEYGTTTQYGSRTASKSAGSGTQLVTVSAGLTGLKAGTEYHFRLVATSNLGTSRGADIGFSTVGPPVTTTGQVVFAALGPTSARVTGIVNPRGLVTTVWFEYGQTASYGRRTPSIPIAGLTTDQTVEGQLTELTPGIRYHFRVVAVSSAGTAVGVNKTFPTPRANVPGGGSARCTILGTQGADVLAGTPGNDAICGLGGNDRIAGGGGDDTLVGGPGRDTLSGGAGKDRLLGGAGDDRLSGGARADRLEGGPGSDTLIGGLGRDLLLGGSGSDSMFARDGARDIVDGGAGSDVATVDASLDVVAYVERRTA